MTSISDDQHGSVSIQPRGGGSSPVHLKEISIDDKEYDILWAAEEGKLHELQKLQSKENNFHVVDWDGWTALHCAAGEGHLGCIKWLVSNTSLMIDHKTNGGNNVLHLAALYGHLNILKWIKEKQLITMSVTNNGGNNILHLAALYGHLNIVQWIKEKQLIIMSVSNKHGQNILHLATMCDSSVTLHWIIRNKLISVDSTDKNGDSILHIAAKHDKPVLVDWIIDNKFPIDLTNKNGDTAYDTARKHQKHTIAELLATYGYLLIKDCRQHTVLSPLKEIVRKGNIVVCKGRSGWFLMDSTTTRISCKADDIIRIPSVLLPLLIPVKPTMRLELLIKKLSLLDQISALQVGDEVYVKLDHCSIPLKAVIKFRGILPSMKGEYFGVQLLEETHHGECDGKYQSAQLFSCPPNSGLFISADKLIVLNFDSKLIAEYHKQCASGKAASRFYKVTFVGAEGAGKTSTVRTMLGKPFDPNEPSTIGTSLTFRALVNYFLSWLEPNSEEKVPEIIKLDKSVAIDWKEATATELKTLLDKEYTRELYEKLQSLIQPVIDQPNNLLTDDVRDLPDTAPTSSISSNGGSNNQYSTIASADCKENGSSSPSQVTPDFPNEDDGVKGTVKVVYGNKAEKLSAKAAISDFAGQLRFFSFQLLFLKKHDVIVLTINASVKLDDPIVPREELQYTRERKTAAGMMTTLEAVHFWLQSISARFGMSVVPIGCMSRRSPTVIICCTHAEKLSVAKQQSVVDIIRESLFDKPYAEHLPDKNEEAFHLISNKNRKKFKYAIARLQLVVLKAATPALEEKRPISYLKLEELIGDEVEEGANLIDTTVFTHLANQSGIVGDKDSDAITAALEYCSQRGVLLHFPDVPDISSLVFISPQWLSDLFTTVVNMHDSVPKGFSLQHAWKRYSTHAILEEEFFDYVLEKGSYLDHKTTVIAIMKKFDLLTEVPSKTSFLGETQHSESRKRLFIVPSLLICDPKSSSYEPNEKDQVLLYSFPDQYLPESVLNQLLVRFISWSVEKEFGIHNIQYGFGQFALGKFQVYRLVYNQKFSQLKLIVSQLESCWQEKKLQHSILESFQELLLQLENSLQELMDFYLPSATKPVVFVSCPYCPLNDPPHVPYSKDEMYLYCCKRNPVVEIPKARYIPCGIDSKGLCSQVVTCDVTDHEQMHFNSDAEELSISDMKLINDIIVPKVSAYWHVVLVYLEYDVAFKKELEKKHKGDPRQCCTTLFEDWITSSRGVFPKTYRKLLDVLNQIPELVNAAAEIRRLLGKERTIKASHHSWVTSPDHSSTSDSIEILDQEPTMKQLLNVVYHKVAAHWDKLAYNLNFSFCEVDIIRVKCKHDPLDCCFCLLEEWLCTDHGDPKTWTVLLTAVKKTKQLQSTATHIEEEVTL